MHGFSDWLLLREPLGCFVRQKMSYTQLWHFQNSYGFILSVWLCTHSSWRVHLLSFFCLKQIAWFSYLSTWWSIVQWDYGSLKTKSLHCSVQNPSVHLLGAAITQPTAASELLKSPTKPGHNLKERFMHPTFGMRTYARLCDQSIASIIYSLFFSSIVTAFLSYQIHY